MSMRAVLRAPASATCPTPAPHPRDGAGLRHGPQPRRVGHPEGPGRDPGVRVRRVRRLVRPYGLPHLYGGDVRALLRLSLPGGGAEGNRLTWLWPPRAFAPTPTPTSPSCGRTGQSAAPAAGARSAADPGDHQPLRRGDSARVGRERGPADRPGDDAADVRRCRAHHLLAEPLCAGGDGHVPHHAGDSGEGHAPSRRPAGGRQASVGVRGRRSHRAAVRTRERLSATSQPRPAPARARRASPQVRAVVADRQVTGVRRCRDSTGTDPPECDAHHRSEIRKRLRPCLRPIRPAPRSRPATRQPGGFSRKLTGTAASQPPRLAPNFASALT